MKLDKFTLIRQQAMTEGLQSLHQDHLLSMITKPQITHWDLPSDDNQNQNNETRTPINHFILRL